MYQGQPDRSQRVCLEYLTELQEKFLNVWYVVDIGHQSNSLRIHLGKSVKGRRLAVPWSPMDVLNAAELAVHTQRSVLTLSDIPRIVVDFRVAAFANL